MRQSLNAFLHGIGYLFILSGIVMCISAAGLADLDGTLTDIARYGAAGVVSEMGGLFLTRWRV